MPSDSRSAGWHHSLHRHGEHRVDSHSLLHDRLEVWHLQRFAIGRRIGELPGGNMIVDFLAQFL